MTEEDLTVLVTGATSGIGLATARKLAAGGAFVLVHGRDEGRVADALVQLGGEAAPFASLRVTTPLPNPLPRSVRTASRSR